MAVGVVDEKSGAICSTIRLINKLESAQGLLEDVGRVEAWGGRGVDQVQIFRLDLI